MKTIINAEEVRQITARLIEINTLDFNDIEWHENGAPLQMDEMKHRTFEMHGLNNADFIKKNMHKA